MSAKTAAKAAQAATKNSPAPGPSAQGGEAQPIERALGNRDTGRAHGALQISRPGDADEREADRVAREVMAKTFDGSEVARRPVQVQRKCSACEEEELPVRRKAAAPEAAPAEAHSSAVIAEGGRPLGSAARRFFEPRFGHGFEQVRIHDDAAADRSARGLGAKAYTVGNHISFAGGQYSPGTLAGRELLAHELTHVLQQRNGAARPKIQREEDEESAQVARLSHELIPTATVEITLDGVWFRPNDEAIFQRGPKLIQLVRIVLKTLVGDRYSDALAMEVTARLESVKQQFARSGHFEDERDAYAEEKIQNFYFGIEPFLVITRYLESENIEVRFDDAQWMQLRKAYAFRILWIHIVHTAGEEGMPLPRWYGEEMFKHQIGTRMTDLETYRDLLFAHMETGDETAREQGAGVANVLFYDLYDDIALLEAMRTDTGLYKDPATQAVYQAVWYLTDKQREKDKPALFLRSAENAFALVDFAAKNDLRLDAQSDPESLRELLRKFVSENGIPEQNLKLLPPYPAFIAGIDLNEDNTTVASATNTFRMVLDTDIVHGGTLLHRVTIAMARDIHYSWSVTPLPDSLKYMHDKTNIKPAELVKEADAFVKNSPENLKAPLKRYSADENYEQRMDMDDPGIGDYLLVGHAAPRYRQDMHWVQKPSTAGYPFFVRDPTQLASSSAYSEWDMLSGLREQQSRTEDPEEKKTYQQEIERLEGRESSGLREVTRGDIADTEKLLESARKLKLFIEDDRRNKIPMQGDATTDPFIIRLQDFDTGLYEVYMLIQELYDPRLYDDLTAIDEYIKILAGQKKELEKLGLRVDDAYGRFKAGSPVFRVVAALVKEDDGNVVPLLLVAGYHPDADPANGKHKIKLVDVTFDAPDMDDMIHVGDTAGNEKDAVQKAFVTFGEDNKYGEGKIVYRLPQTTYKGTADSVTTTLEYLEYALAALGLILLIAGTIASAGALSPAAAAVIMVLGVSLAVVSAAMSVRNMARREERGTLEMDAETALDIINIIGAVVMVVGTVTRVTMAARAATLARVLTIQRLERLIAVYDFTELGANIYLLNAKVKEDIDAIERLGLPPEQEKEMISAVTFEAIQQGAMMGISAHSTLRQVPDLYRKRVETSGYKSWMEKGWIRAVGDKLEITDAAPPFLRRAGNKAGTVPPAEHQGDFARKSVVTEPMQQNPTRDGQHTLTLTERGRIIRCSDLCQDLRARYERILAQDPELQQRLLAIEKKAATASGKKDNALAKEALDEATELEAALRWADDQWGKFTGTGSGEAAQEAVAPGAVTAPAKQPRLDVVDLMTEAEMVGKGGMQQALTRLGNLMGKTVAEIPVLKVHWEAAVTAALKGKPIGDHTPESINKTVFPKASRLFWQRVAKDPAAVAFLKESGFDIGKKGGAPMALLGPAGKAKGIDAEEGRVALERRAGEDGKGALDADRLQFMFHARPKATRKPSKAPVAAAKDAFVLTPEERRLATHGKSLGMLDTEIERFIEQFRAMRLSADDMLRQMDQWAETLQANPKARARMAPDFILDPASRARLPDFEQRIAGTGGIEKITARDSGAEEGGGLAVTIEGVVLPGRLARRKKDVTKTRRRAPDFNRSDKLFSVEEAGLNKNWQRLHLWGPGFGDEAAAGMMWGPRKVNLVWQNDSIESYIRQLAMLTDRYGGRTRVKATAIAWENPTPGGWRAPQGENFLKRAEYVITLQRPGQPDTTIRVTLDVSEPPKPDIASFSIDPPHAVNLGDIFP